MIQFRDVAWRAMSGYDIGAVSDIANRVHPGFFESQPVLEEKYTLYRNGCYLLEVSEKPAGYVLSHPWTSGSLPALDTMLGSLPEPADTYYIHDLALLPLTRGVGAAGKIVDALTKHAIAMGFPTMSLVAVNGSVGFWEKRGFACEDRPDLAGKLAAYEDAARYMVKPLT
ncbi:Acetyltransferase (GNAT) family protein [Devosia lucknowensis]|uniref:Acetyltransferase (GNAT) family protein n=1 Tax=Devosia lucknowensis TaxID=1096929 RepID=A0A1Y6GCQ2_9HYPH|nr:GNAT family N-acetyltransferase [Devosia lucknowensis]SMQ85849.1 Acetyltransferase (GNAT) family protein [Devosia lucknowensis]